MRIFFINVCLIFCFVSSCSNTPKEVSNEISDSAAQVKQSKINISNPNSQKLDLTVHDQNTKVKAEKTQQDASKQPEEKIQIVEKNNDQSEAKVVSKPVETIKSKTKSSAPKEKVEKKIVEKVTKVKTETVAATKVAVKEKEKEIIKEEKKAAIAKEEIKEAVKKPEVFSHAVWNGLLSANVSSSGKVNYAGFKANQNQLDAYIKALSENTPQSDWPSKKEIAYWINAYNAGTVKLILNNYPVKSIKNLHGGKPWDVKWLELGGKKYSLNEIENDILRPKFKDARVHFAVNCAAKSCPPLLNKAWTSENLESTYERQTKAFINNSSYNTISENEVEISKIFEWYAEDFGDIITFLNKYSTLKISPNAKVSYKEYIWDLNN